MIIVLLLFFKSICLYCQRLILHIHDRWINPKNVRLLKEAAEAKGSKFLIEEYRQAKKSKKRRCATPTTLSNAFTDSNSCRFCTNTPQGYCRHHFHLQELHVQKQQRQQTFWCPLSDVFSRGANHSTNYRQLRKIKRELKRNIQQQQQQQQQQKSAKTSTIIYGNSNNNLTTFYSPPTDQSNSVSSSLTIDSGYQTTSMPTSTLGSLENNDSLLEQESEIVPSTREYIDINLLSPSKSVAEKTNSFEAYCESPLNTPLPLKKSTIYDSFLSCEYTALSTSYL